MKYLKTLLATALLVPMFVVSFAVLTPSTASAGQAAYCQQQIGGFFGFPTWYKYLDVEFGTANCDINFDATKPGNYVGVGMAMFEIVMRIAGLAAIVFVMWGAFQFLISRGEPDKIAGARSTLINALVGLVIALSAVGIVNIIGTYFV